MVSAWFARRGLAPGTGSCLLDDREEDWMPKNGKMIETKELELGECVCALEYIRV